MYGAEPDSPALMARDLFAGGAVHGDLALIEAAVSQQAFAHLASLGVTDVLICSEGLRMGTSINMKKFFVKIALNSRSKASETRGHTRWRNLFEVLFMSGGP